MLLFFCLNRCRHLAYAHTHIFQCTLTHRNTYSHVQTPFAAPSLSPCPMWAVASAAGPLTVVMAWNIPVTPAGLTSPLCLRVPCKAPCYPASCFPQVLSTDRGHERRRQRNKHRPPLTWWSVARRGLQIPAMVHIFSKAPKPLPAYFYRLWSLLRQLLPSNHTWRHHCDP